MSNPTTITSDDGLATAQVEMFNADPDGRYVIQIQSVTGSPSIVVRVNDQAIYVGSSGQPS